nr:bifunctional adenosylcobinamide kinase/adenosylcobinamide-phosphate guanylyltransferase [Amylibacter sp.]
MLTFPKLTLVLGGAASGKSHFAEQLVSHSGLPRSYIATAQAFDSEMREKILEHQKDRGNDWNTIEAPIAVPEVLQTLPDHQITLVDCLTLWLTNLILAENGTNPPAEDPATLFLAAASACNFPIVTVSNEVGHSIVPESALGRRFQRAQGRLNARIAQHADLVVMVTAGLPQVLKGQLPEGLT